MSPKPSRIRKQLGAELRVARKLAGLNQETLADLLEVAQPTISRIESGTGPLLWRDQVTDWLNECSAPPDLHERAQTLLQAAHAETRPYPELVEGGHLQADVLIEERDARLIRSHQLVCVPGLLQTAEYTRLFIPQLDPTGTWDPAASAAARMERQRILYEPGRRFEFLISDSALLWSPGPGVMPAQLNHIASLATLASVEIGVLPVRREGAPAWESFTYTVPKGDGPIVVTSELLGGRWQASDPAVVEQYARVWSELREASLQGEDAIALIRRIADGT